MTRHISIHAPREGSDPLRSRYVIPALNFYPRSPRGERPGSFCGRAITPHFYPRSPRGERLRVGDRGDLHFGISIHAPREGSDEANFQRFWPDEVISIHAPREGSDRRVLQSTGRNNISIHAPREGSDVHCYAFESRLRHFYPRSPRGERPADGAGRPHKKHFYPRSPRGERHF